MILNSFVDIFKNVFLSEYAIVLTSCTIIVVMFVLSILSLFVLAGVFIKSMI